MNNNRFKMNNINGISLNQAQHNNVISYVNIENDLNNIKYKHNDKLNSLKTNMISRININPGICKTCGMK